LILYVNGDSHTAAAEASNPYVFACDDGEGELWRLGKRSHPDNDRVSWGFRLANLLESAYVNDSESASSNFRIMRTTRDWLASNTHLWDDVLLIIQWSTWERQEWLIDGEWYQINASGQDQVPDGYQAQYRQYILEVDWTRCTQDWHHRIWMFHCHLRQRNIRHVFFNGNNYFGEVPLVEQDWQTSYMHPYSRSGTYDQILRDNGYQTVNSNSWHFGPDAHCFWSQYVLNYCVDNNLVNRDAICTD
jgi:hypothetical protein